MSQNRAKMSAHSRAALDAADTLRRVIGGMNDTPFMQEGSSDSPARAETRERRATLAQELVGDLPQSLLERIGREMEQEHGL